MTPFFEGITPADLLREDTVVKMALNGPRTFITLEDSHSTVGVFEILPITFPGRSEPCVAEQGEE